MVRAVVEYFWRQRPDVLSQSFVIATSAGVRTSSRCFHACQGDYIAIVEGDDYWTAARSCKSRLIFWTRTRLHRDLLPCARTRYEDGSQPPRINRRSRSRCYTLDDLLAGNVVPTCTVHRSATISSLIFPHGLRTCQTGDWPLQVLNAQHGDILYRRAVMAVQRIHSSGVWSPKPASERRESMVSILKTFRDNLDPRNRPVPGTKHRALAVQGAEHALLIEGRYAAAGVTGLDLLLHPDVSRAARCWLGEPCAIRLRKSPGLNAKLMRSRRLCRQSAASSLLNSFIERLVRLCIISNPEQHPHSPLGRIFRQPRPRSLLDRRPAVAPGCAGRCSLSICLQQRGGKLRYAPGRGRCGASCRIYLQPDVLHAHCSQHRLASAQARLSPVSGHRLGLRPAGHVARSPGAAPTGVGCCAADYVTCVSQNLADVAATLGIVPDRIEVAPRGVDTCFCPVGDGDALRHPGPGGRAGR